jgi:hypothetical protein
MGYIEKNGDGFVFRQVDGKITARFSSLEEKKVLAHEGSPAHKKVFYFLVLAGALYLTNIFIFF